MGDSRTWHPAPTITASLPSTSGQAAAATSRSPPKSPIVRAGRRTGAKSRIPPSTVAGTTTNACQDRSALDGWTAPTSSAWHPALVRRGGRDPRSAVPRAVVFTLGNARSRVPHGRSDRRASHLEHRTSYVANEHPFFGAHYHCRNLRVGLHRRAVAHR